MPTESNRCFGMVISGVGEQSEWLEAFFHSVKMYLGCLMLKRKLLPLIIELVVILNHLGTIYFWHWQKLTNFVTPHLLHPQKWTTDHLFFKKESVSDFKTPLPPTPLLCECQKFMVPYMFTVIWSFFCFRKKYHPVVWTINQS